MDYQKDIAIDESALEIEWLQQPSLVFKYSEMSALMKKQVSIAKEELDVVKARLDKLIRLNPEDYGIGKITEAAINAEILMHDDYKEANNAYIEALYENNMCQAAVAALDAKKSALENLVKLYGQNYFSGPSAPRDISAEWNSRQRASNTNRKIRIGGRKGAEEDDDD